ncbi:potassium transporter Kup [Algiphilus sp. W345]|uniref:Probable potassium transport system protein Kup n=1 Tax=Banduia mediterranea TaxID=3075609 RepID=A0ABU2WL85_9GAMM|nr:potassium transporter Kup [Algiphilus sp. W345]MDT0498649.1 potassium transporter Kup [Algiphilus sp. W345]
MIEKPKLATLCLATLGIVYGDIGTSPLYALRECFLHEGIEATHDNVLGILSLILWALILVISCKYLLFVMRADNRGEGGVAALVALLNPWQVKPGSQRYLLMLLGLFGAALIFGDGTITPAISVLSAVEGLETATPAFKPFVIPVALIILVGLFSLQHRGTAKVGRIFGPIIVVWFLVLATLGLNGILQYPAVLAAANPAHAYAFFASNGFAGFAVLGSVFLVVTGGEALYADMGHLGRAPIRITWFVMVLPALLLNYFGQGALILDRPEATKAPFYELAPDWATYPLVALATLATIIASQAVITGVFSLTRQLVQLGQLPRVNIVQTSPDEQGQIYIPLVNWLMMLATIGLVIGFGSSSALASAYGIAVATTMVISTILAFFVARRFGWNLWLSAALLTVFLIVDFSFFGANLLKLADGGFYPLGVAILVFVLMRTWARGRQLLSERWGRNAITPSEFAKLLIIEPPHRIDGTAVFFTSGYHVPPYLLRHLARHRVMQERIILLEVETRDEPRVMAAERLLPICVAPGVMYVKISYGFMQDPNVPLALRLAEKLGMDLELDAVTYYLGRQILIPTRNIPGMWLWQERLFAVLSRNATRVTAFFRLPPKDVVELGFQVEI